MLIFLFISNFCFAEDTPDTRGSPFPEIERLDWRDEGFKQFTADVEINRRRIFNRDRTRESADAFAGALTVYQYTPREGEDIFHLAARCSIPYSALASLNRINHPSLLETGKPLLLPTVPGIFVPENPESDLEQLIVSSRLSEAEFDSARLVIGRTAGEGPAVFHFLPGSEFNATERAFFLNSGFRFPLRSFRLTSGFGMRTSPISGQYRLHEGVDLAAPAGTEVYAAGNGVVTAVGEDSVYGIYIVIKHNDNWASLYGHLQRAGVTLHSSVRSGSLIGWVGSTGQSTGPHLHFELRQNGRAQDPDKYLFRPQRP